MPSGKFSKQIGSHPAEWILALLVLLTQVHAEQLPIRTYTSADGLAQDRVKRIVLDSRGFLWFCTAAGLSRFDGSRFVTYDSGHGLSYPTLNDLLQTRAGTYWVASNGGGVFLFSPTAGRSVNGASSSFGTRASLFKNYPVGETAQTNRVNRLFEDRGGRIWAGTDDGLFVLDSSSSFFERVAIPELEGRQIWAFEEDGDDNLWIGASTALVARAQNGQIRSFNFKPKSATNVMDVLIDRSGRVWVAHTTGLAILKPGTASSPSYRLVRRSFKEFKQREIVLPAGPGDAYTYDQQDGLLSNFISSVFEANDGRIWLGGSGGINVFDGSRFHSYTGAQGLPSGFTSITEDREHNLWFGSVNGGALKLAHKGLLTYRTQDGLANPQVIRIFEDKDCRICVLDRGSSIACLTDQKFEQLRIRLQREPRLEDVIQDHLGYWWITGGQYLYRFPSGGVVQLERSRPKLFGPADGLSGSILRRLFEDSRGDIWIVSLGNKSLARWERATEKFHLYGADHGIPNGVRFVSFSEDRDGGVLIGSRDHGLWRYEEGRFEMLKEMAMPSLELPMVYVDRAGRIWTTVTAKGLIRIDDPSNPQTGIRTYSTADGLSSNLTSTILEDNTGRIYVGTARSVDMIDPATGRIKQYTVADGLAANESTTAYKDSCGKLWFGTTNGLSRLVPETAEQVAKPPPVFISGLSVAGVPQQLAELGETTVADLRFDHTQNQLRVDFFGLAFAIGDVLRYQFKLEGADHDWSPPLDQRSVHYANLRPGSYVFRVRAVNADGLASSDPASVSFMIESPFWQRWWFITLLVLIVVVSIHLIYRYHTQRLIELERVRTRIATDLHDDIGASLSKIAILSEVAGQEVASTESRVVEPLAVIAATSRDMVDAMSDIVWAVNPQRDHLSDLTHRMRRFAEDLLEACDLEFTFKAPFQERDVRLGADLRREVYLIFKELVNNLVKHSRCTRAELEFGIEGSTLAVHVTDNGIGFDVGEILNGRPVGLGGHGLASIQRRATSLGGLLSVQSEPGKGTRVMLKVPLNHRSRRWLWRYLNGR